MRQKLGVIILGASQFDYLDSEPERTEPLGDPRFAESARQFHELFKGEIVVGKPETKILDLYNYAISPSEMSNKVLDFANSRSFDDLIIYFCGHGVVPLRMDYVGYLRLTKEDRPGATALQLKTLLRDLSNTLFGKQTRVFTVRSAQFSGIFRRFARAGST
jgi:hypothetical protein